MKSLDETRQNNYDTQLYLMLPSDPKAVAADTLNLSGGSNGQGECYQQTEA